MQACARSLLIGFLTVVFVFFLSGSSFAQRDDRVSRDGRELPDHVRRLDRNGNGMIERDEVPESWRSRWDPWLKRLGLDPDRTVSMRKLAERKDRDERQRDSREASGDVAEPEVPGFGNEFEDEPVLGFGDEDEDGDWRGDYDRRSFDSARDTIRRYDRNRNGVLDRSEWKSVPWRSDPNESDLNRDGRLTLKEMTARHDLHNKGQQNPRARNSSSGSSSRDRGRGSSSGGSGNPGSPGGGDMNARILSFYQNYDKNKNGRFEPDEIAASRRLTERIRESGLDPRQTISVQEFAKKRAERMSSGGGMMARFSGGRGPGGGAPSSGGSNPAGSNSSSKSTKKRKGYDPNDPKTFRFQTAKEQLPKGLQNWFTGRDKNEDGQVSMAEFTSLWTESKVSEFAHYDLNDDGLITAAEALAQIETPYRGNGASKSLVSGPAASPSQPNKTSPAESSTKPAEGGTIADVPVIRRYFDNFDKDKNGVLEKAEWSECALIMRAPKAFDANGDGKIPYSEFAKAYAAKYGG